MENGRLTSRHLLAVYLPLALSWVFMAAEAPICARFVNALPDHRVQTAAQLVLFSVALFIESPVIDLLATSTTLSKSREDFRAIRKFSVWLMAWCGVVHLLVVAIDPLYYGVMSTALSQPREVVEAARLPLLVMVPWSPAIGWRRHIQGLLISRGVTRPIGAGTAVRVCTIAIVGFLGYSSHALPGAMVAALALVCSVTVEALFIQFAASRVLGQEHWPAAGEQKLSAKSLASFHLPLTVATMLLLCSTPLVSRALAVSPESLLSMNGWQVSTTLAFMMRTVTFALPEVVIANWNNGESRGLLLRFCLTVGSVMTLLMLGLSLLGGDTWFFSVATHADPEVAASAHKAFMFCSLLPLLTAATSYFKGVLTIRRVTGARLLATTLSIGTLFAALSFGVKSQWPGVLSAAAAITVSLVVELVALSAYARFAPQNSSERMDLFSTK